MTATSAVVNGAATILVHFDQDNPPDSISDLESCIEILEDRVDDLKTLIFTSPMDIGKVDELADWLVMEAQEVANEAAELYAAAKASNGLNVTTGATA